ncbi:MAG TPA: GNAT family N-acetyltransferase [Nitrosomonas sp.]|nr:GNAT family N-acetyltransferase [Nitrosomonas sp.]
MIKNIIKSILRILFKDYQFIRIYYLDLPESGAHISEPELNEASIRRLDSQDQFFASNDQRIRDHSAFFDDQTFAYGMYTNDELIGVCVFWKAGHPNLPGRFSQINENEAVMVDLLISEKYRGKGYALAITLFSEYDLAISGYKKLWTWIWHSNAPSIRVFEKAGWVYSHQLIELQPYGIKSHLRFKLPAWER